ncbi:MAG: ACP S-malonyltransferase, partial [Oscillospiraceae bacterium]
MGQSLWEISPAAKEIFHMAEKLRPGTEAQCFHGSSAELSLTQNTQPCLFSVDLAAACALAENGIYPACVAGFSLGEIPAVAFSGMLSYEDAFRLVIRRGEFMQQAAEATEGAMAAVLRLTNAQVEELAKKHENVYPVNYNCPGQLVVAGEKSALEAFKEEAAQLKGRVKMLNVSGGFHSPFMKTAAERLGAELKNLPFSPAKIPVYANFTAQPYGDNPAELLEKQVSNPVRWQETIEHMIAKGVTSFVEVGAGKTLSGLIKKINQEVSVWNVEDGESLAATLKGLNR